VTEQKTIIRKPVRIEAPTRADIEHKPKTRNLEYRPFAKLLKNFKIGKKE